MNTKSKPSLKKDRRAHDIVGAIDVADEALAALGSKKSAVAVRAYMRLLEAIREYDRVAERDWNELPTRYRLSWAGQGLALHHLDKISELRRALFVEDARIRKLRGGTTLLRAHLLASCAGRADDGSGDKEQAGRSDGADR